MQIPAGTQVIFVNQTINDAIHNDGELMFVNCISFGKITGTGNLTCKGGNICLFGDI